MKKRITMCCGSILLLLILSAVGMEVRLTYEEFPEEPDRSVFQPYASAQPELSLTCPEGEWKLPPLLSEKPLYTLVQLGEDRRLGVLDKVEKSDPFYRRFYLDLNGNQDLTDDLPIDAPRERGSTPTGAGLQRAVFPARSLKVSEGGELVPYRFRPQLYRFMRGRPSQAGAERDKELLDSLRFTLYASCTYRGRVKAGTETYDIWLSDANANGLFDEPAVFLPPDDPSATGRRLSAAGTQIYATCDRKPSFYDGCPLGAVLVLRDKTFKVDLDIPGSKLVLEPLEEGTAPVDLAMTPSSLVLCPVKAGPSVTMIDPASSVRIPRDTYRLMSYRVFRKGEKGGLWSLHAAGTVGSPVTQVASANARLGFGEPFVPSAEVPRGWNPRGGMRSEDLRAPLVFVLEGAMKERITDLRLHEGEAAIDMAKGRGDQHLPTEATFQIATPEGEVVHSGAFEYG